MRNRKKLFCISLFVFLFSFFAAIMLSISVEKDTHIYPDYPKENITPILLKKEFSYEDYKTLFYQTGLGKIAIDEIIENENNYIEKITDFQNAFFKNINFVCKKNSIISREEHLIDDNEKYIYGTNLAPYHNGYILITKSSHTFNWRNGHAGIIVNEENHEVLESFVLGENSDISDINKWINYPNFIILRLKDSSNELLYDISKFALENLNDIPYSLTVGLLSPKYNKVINGTNCSHLIWYCFKHFGYNIDYDGGFIVTPKDIAKSPLLEVVQVYGVNPKDIWP